MKVLRVNYCEYQRWMGNIQFTKPAYFDIPPQEITKDRHF